MLMLSMSMVTPSEMRMFSMASLMIESVFSPRKSILMSPVSSMTLPSYCVQ
ncbi:hypothetical protein EVA_08377 [gut metagenome]|uniref:Uncharacterized protein n=1 Tax=gut metagenome TaxID=749906 RepID=J9G9H6_9ZZZZ